MFHANANQNRVWMSICISDKIDCQRHNIVIKGSIHQEDIKIVNIYVPNIRVPKYIKQPLTELKGEVDSNT